MEFIIRIPVPCEDPEGVVTLRVGNGGLGVAFFIAALIAVGGALFTLHACFEVGESIFGPTLFLVAGVLFVAFSIRMMFTGSTVMIDKTAGRLGWLRDGIFRKRVKTYDCSELSIRLHPVHVSGMVLPIFWNEHAVSLFQGDKILLEFRRCFWKKKMQKYIQLFQGLVELEDVS